MSRESAGSIQDQASHWVARMDGSGWTDEAEAQLSHWLAEDPRHDGALLIAQAAWAMLDQRAESAADAADADAAANDDQPPPRGMDRRWVLGGLGAAVAASAAGFFVFSDASTRYATDIGEIRRVPLADGSTAAINTASRIDVTLGRKLRRVVLDHGEAWFQVAKDTGRPFVVEAGSVRVRAVGTAFAVRIEAGGAKVSVTEGVVEAWNETTAASPIRLEAGAQAFIADSGRITTPPPERPGVDRTLAWRAGKIDLMGQPLSAAVAEFNRYNRRQIVITDARLREEAFDGVFRTDDPAGFAQMVHVSLDAPIDLSDPDKISIGSSRR